MFKQLFQVLSQKSLMIQALDKAYGALDRAEKLTQAAFRAVLEGDDPGFDLYASDREINRAEIEVRRMVFQHLATSPGGELTSGLILTSVIIDIERIGDYAKNVYDLRERVRPPMPRGDYFDDVRAMLDEVLGMFDEVSKALRSGSSEGAHRVMKEHADIGRRCEDIVERVLESQSLAVREAVILALLARFLKRISAHLSNLASSVVNPFDRIGFRPDSKTPLDADD